MAEEWSFGGMMQAAGEEIPQYQTTAVYMLVPEPAGERMLQVVA